MKRLIAKILLMLSYIPYLFLFSLGIFSSIFGFTISSYTSYGIDAFFDCIIDIGFLLCCSLIIPICFAYQSIYLILSILKKKHTITKKIIIITSLSVIFILILIGIFIIYI